MIFTDSGSCQSRVHCATCRDREGGRAWRESLACCYTMPEGSPDFPCPHGGDWEKPPPDRGLGDKLAKVLHAVGVHKVISEECVGCRDRQGGWNRLLPSP